jgi:hypothetical protein
MGDVMTKDEFNWQWQHKKDAVADAQKKLWVAQDEERKFIAEHGPEMLGLSKGDVLRTVKDGKRYVVASAGLRNGRLEVIAYFIKKNGKPGDSEMPNWHEWTVEKKGTPE